MREMEASHRGIDGGCPVASSEAARPGIGLAGVWLLAAGMLVVMSGCQATSEQIVTVYQSRHQDIDGTCEHLKTALEAQGFSYRGTLNLNASMAKHGVRLDRQVRIVQFGSAKHAHAMLMAQPEISAMVPCQFGVYQGDANTVCISTVNKALVAGMFGGVVGDVMGGDILRAQTDVLNTVGRPLALARQKREVLGGIRKGDPHYEISMGQTVGGEAPKGR